MTKSNTIMNSDEQVVAVREIVNGEETVFYAIRDMYLGYWRTARPLDDHAAWTKNRRRRAEFRSRVAALRELQTIWQWRGRDVGSEAMIAEYESEAA